MANEKTSKISFKEAFMLNLRAYKLWWKKCPMVIITSALNSAAGALTPYVGIYITARIINEIAGRRDPATLIRWVIISLIATASVSAITAALTRWNRFHNTMAQVKHEKIYVEKLLSLDFFDVDNTKTHELYSQIIQNWSWQGWGLSKALNSFDGLVRVPLTIIGAFALTFTLFTSAVPESDGWLTVLNNPLFVVLIIAMLVGVTLITPILNNKANSFFTKFDAEMKQGNRYFSWFSSTAHERPRSLDIRVYRQDKIYMDYIYKSENQVYGTKSRFAGYAKTYIGLLNVLSAMVSRMFTAMVYIFVGLKAWGGAFGIGSVTQYVGAISSMSNGVNEFITVFGSIRNNAPFLQTTFEFLDIPNSMYQGSLTTEKRSDHKYEIEFRNVSFKYPAANEYALKNVSIKFKIGQRLAIVGQNGSGKTTFIKLLCRLYDPTEGEILLNGIDIKKYDYLQYMSIYSVVFQDFKLLAAALGQNIAAQTSFDSAKAEDCLEKTGFGERLYSMPNGLESYLYKDFEKTGVDISGGEAQKIALSRALYKDAHFAVLDEPTAALDPVAEFEIYSKMNEIVGEKTAVFISHRLSSCRFCNDIAVFHDGELIQRGSHDALIAEKQGKYNELWNAQAQYYNTDLNTSAI